MRCSCKPRSASELRNVRALLAGCMGLALAAVPAAAGATLARQYAVVVSPDVDVRTLTVSELRRIFLFERRFWKSGRPVIPLMPASGARSRRYLLAGICGTDEGQFRQMVLEKMYRGELDLAPKV